MRTPPCSAIPRNCVFVQVKCRRISCGQTTRARTCSCATLTPRISGTSWWTTFSAPTLQVRALSTPAAALALTRLVARSFLPDVAIADLRLVLLEWCSCCRSEFDAGSCQRYKTRGGWLQGLTPLDSLELGSYVVLLLFNVFGRIRFIAGPGTRTAPASGMCCLGTTALSASPTSTPRAQ